MINVIWLCLVVIGIIIAGINGNIDAIPKSMLDSAKTAVELSLGLIGVMALWLGIMKIAEVSGITKLMARVVRPVMRFLFPEVPADHPAIGSMTMNIVANMLGLGDAATPLGLKAMDDLQSLNKIKDTASNAMVTFLAINATNVEFIPALVIGLRVAAGSSEPTVIIATTLFATGCSTICAVIASKILEKLPAYKRPEPVTEGGNS